MARPRADARSFSRHQLHTISPVLASEISPFSRGGHIVHSYADHASVLKFIERNWYLRPITNRSRDNLPNPITLRGNPYVPINMTAIGDLFDMFDFDGQR